jgi:uncharacterized metal-binding protein YceD (DUF177 family)
MCSDMTLKIDLEALNEEFSSFRYALDDSFFASLPTSDIKKGKLTCQLTIRKIRASYELNFHIEGSVTVACDRCLEDMEQPITADNKLIVKLGEEYSEDDELIVVSEENPVIDVSWLIYEFITLSIPLRHTHAQGQCNADMLRYITSDDDISGVAAGNTDKTVDPRWSKLTELLEKN